MIKKKENYLDYIPKYKEGISWEENVRGQVVIKVRNTGFFNKVARLFFRKPEFSFIEMDEFGSFVWMQINGKKSIYEIGLTMKNKFGDKAEPLYERLAGFLSVLHEQEYVDYVNTRKCKGFYV